MPEIEAADNLSLYALSRETIAHAVLRHVKVILDTSLSG